MLNDQVIISIVAFTRKQKASTMFDRIIILRTILNRLVMEMPFINIIHGILLTRHKGIMSFPFAVIIRIPTTIFFAYTLSNPQPKQELTPRLQNSLLSLQLLALPLFS